MATAADTEIPAGPDGETDNSKLDSKPTGKRERRASIIDDEQEQPEMVARTETAHLAKLNDDSRKRLFDMAETDIPPSRTFLPHQIVKNPTECLRLSDAIDALSSIDKKKLFEACLDIPESDEWENNTFNYACDPDGYHEMAAIKIDSIPEKCFLKVDYIKSYQEEVYPDDLTKCVRVFTLMQADEY